MRAFQKCEVQRDRRLGFGHGNRDAMVAHDQPELLHQIAFEQIGARYGGRIVAGRGHVPIGEARVDLRIGLGGDADLGIEGAIAPRLALAFAQVLERLAQEGGVAVVERLQGGDGLPGIGEALAREGLRAGNRFDGFWVDLLFHDPL